MVLRRLLVTGLLVSVLAAAVDTLGAVTGGLLAALPVLASLLAVFTHRESGPAAAIEPFRGTLAGMAGFVAFCQPVAVVIVPVGAIVGLISATALALLLQTLVARYSPALNWAGRSGEASASACRSRSASRSAA
jgi:TRAP-type uncharacterized transport system fused permease subunit